MLSLMPANVPPRRGLSRREALLMSLWSASGASLAQVARPALAAPTSHRPSAKNCINIFLCGGPSQLDMWDPKPEAPDHIRGPIGSIETNVPGIRLGELLPTVARHADKFSIIRSMNIGTQSHDIGILRTLLASRVGTEKNKPYPAEASDHPALGAILHKLLGSHEQMPPWAVIPRHFTTGDRFYKGQTAGFLGPAYAPFALETEKKGSLARTEFPLQHLDLYGAQMTERRFGRRHGLLRRLQSVSPGPGDQFDAVRQLQQNGDAALRMLTSRRFKEAFDVTREPGSLREKYGLNEYGQSFLLARRLIEREVRLVNVFWTF